MYDESATLLYIWKGKNEKVDGKGYLKEKSLSNN